MRLSILLLLIPSFTVSSIAFIFPSDTPSFLSKSTNRISSSLSVSGDPLTISNTVENNASEDENTEIESQEQTFVSSFLKFIGPYPALSLRFPSLSTESQRERNETGISIDFILDTAANTNTINAQVANELQLNVVGEALPGYSAGGAIEGGSSTFLVGNCTLDMPEKRNETFMVDLTASALPIASPAAAGLVGVAFLNCFEGGVKFDWGGGIDDRQPMVTFHGNSVYNGANRMRKVPITILEETLLPSVTLRINGVDIPALLDTGSPITVLNSFAAEKANVKVIELESDNKEETKGGFNPFKKLTDGFKEAQVLADAASKGDIVLIGGANGERVELRKTKMKQSLSLNENNNEGEVVSFPSTNIYVGDLPGLAALGGLKGPSSSNDVRPAAILGMDVIKKISSMLYTKDAVYF